MKNKELETLQKNYDSKLHTINKYIESISPSTTGTVPEEQLINAISNLLNAHIVIKSYGIIKRNLRFC